ncbi:MAG: tRNA (adenosine(37)-N6)-threonylcarbamoyltransferase complex ATPase subunit type 1 TsaE [Oscillospiraceae bacterium]|nr:tRNA (adenosine(37)-N6)-threonylcarbamoyltransferase complex ATPase subunit type 1 TsaE [Oscillospiraceae bacterium]
MKYFSSSCEETIKLGDELGRKISPDTAVLLYGEMGAGKTHFVKGIARGLGICANITSPTFALVNEYEGKLFHFDLFRVQSSDDLYSIGFYDYIGRGNIVIEWSENVPELEDEFENCYKVEIKKLCETKIRDEQSVSKREIIISPNIEIS